MITVAKVTKTCGACPAQWEGQTNDGRFVYARYRWGYLCIGLGDSLGAAIAAEGGIIFEWENPDHWHGFMEYEELVHLTKDAILWPDFEELSLV